MSKTTKIFEIQLDTKRPLSNEKIELVAGDTGNVFEISLVDDGEPVDLSNCRVVAVFAHTGGTSLQDSDTVGNGVSVSQNKITIELRQASYRIGTTECEIQVYSGETRDVLITSARFNFRSREPFFSSETVQSTNEYPVLVQLISDATEAAQAANAAADLVEGSAAAAEEAVTAAQEAVAAAQEAVETAVAATVEVGTVTTGAPGTNASVVNVGTKYAAILDFTIPRGNPSNVKVGNQDPDSVASSLSVGDIYIYCPTMP